MNLDGLTQQFEANKGPILATAAAGVIGFALYQRHKSGTGNASAPAQGVAVDPGTYSSGGQLAGTAYSSAASDAYDLLQPQLESLGQKLNSVPVSKPPSSPIASTLFAPAGSGRYVRYQNGMVAEIEPDGSQLNLTGTEFANLTKQLGSNLSLDQLQGTGGGAGTYDVAHNLARAKTSGKS